MERCHTSICGQRGCPLQGGCCNLLHRLNSSTNSAEPPAHVSAAHCTSDEARLEEEEDTLNCSPHSSFNMFSTVSDELMKDTYKYKDIHSPKTETYCNLLLLLRLLAQRMKYLIRLHISAIFFCRVASVVAVTLDLLDCMLSVSFWT